MAVTPSKSAGAAMSGAGARFRQRKISVKISLPIYNANEISATDSDLEPSQLHHLNASAQQARDLHTVETGVDKNEEDEVHLQQVINAAQRVLLGDKEKDSGKESSSVYIPTPDASKLWPEASKFYRDESFVEPESYIKFSATVEDTLGVEYNMDEVDEEFFNNVLTKEKPKQEKQNGSAKSSDSRPCTMLEFEALCDKFEKTIEEKQPFLSMDPSNILSFKELSAAILKDANTSVSQDYSYAQPGMDSKYISTSSLKEKLSKELNFEPFVTTFDKDQESTNNIRSISKLLELYGEQIYNHWKVRKIERKGKSITPTLKFEDPNANEKENDNDPYVCFRRREFRQARKTRRADNLGAERIRLMQKSLKRARDLVFNVCKREILKLQSWEADQEIFNLRSEAKGVKRAVGIKGDDHLFFPRKKKKIIKIEPVEEEDVEAVRIKKEKKRQADSATPSFNQSKDPRSFNGQIQPEASSTQPYVKLPPSKIPDMDLVTVSLVLKEKNDTIKRAVFEKLKKRKEFDKGYANITYDPFQPFFNLSTNDRDKQLELSHIPYSSIAAAYYHQFNTTNMISDHLKKLMEEGKKPYPGMKTFHGANGELVPSKPFPQLQSLLKDHLNNKLNNSPNYIAQLLSNIENNNFSSYTNGFKKDEDQDEEDPDVSGPVFRLRKREGRANRVFIDRKGLISRPDDAIDEWLNIPEEDEDSKEDDEMEGVKETTPEMIKDAYHNKKDSIKRLDSRWKFDDDYTDFDKGIRNPFSLDPSRLNSISDETQSIRFGSMLLSKSYDLLRESAHQRQVLIQQARIRALQQHQLQRNQAQHQGANGSAVPNGHGPGRAGVTGGSSGNLKTLPGYGNAANSANKFGTMNRGQQSYTAQQLQAMQQFRQQQNQSAGTASTGMGQNSGFMAQKRANMGARANMPQDTKGVQAYPQRNAGEVGK